MDVAAVLVNYLDGATDIPWFHDAPSNTPAEFGTLARDGGPTEFVRDLPTVTLLVHARTRGRAAQLAEQAKQALIAAPYEVENVFWVEILGFMDDPLDGRERHRITATLVVND